MELLAPAGAFESLKAAVQSGADAVYIGGSKFSARRSAGNFTEDEIKSAVEYCHLRNTAVHVAANILVKEKEKDEFLSYMGFLSQIGVDAVIIQDIGMAAKTHAMYPDLPLHASTQMTAASVDAVKFLECAGFSRVVLARELSRETVEKICRETDAEIEVFAHGAICMCYSGQCLMSSIIGGRSGNRGMCAQPCRLPYTIDGIRKYHLSPKDLCMVNNLRELKKTGVTSIKIEGRLKRKEYVAAVCGIYRKYIDSGEPISSEDYAELLNAFNRSGFTDGYYSGKIGSKMMSLENPSNISENTFSRSVIERCRDDANFRKSKIYISAALRKNTPFSVTVWDDFGHYAGAESVKNAEEAQKSSTDAQKLSKQLLKLGGTPFYADEPEIDLEENTVISVSEINDTRRRAIQMLEEEIIKAPERREMTVKSEALHRNVPKKILLTAYVSTYEQAEECRKSGIDVIYADTPLANRLNYAVAQLPPIKRDDRRYLTPKSNCVSVSNIGQMTDKKCVGDFRLNITNSESVRFYDNLERITLSPELNLHEMEDIACGCEIIAYGRIPLMITENCPLKNCGKCQNFEMKYSIYDRKNEKFPVKCREGCVCEILNSKPIYMADKIDSLKKLHPSALKLIFTVETPEECRKTAEEYKKALMGEKINTPEENTFTRGHFFRGVE